MNLDCRHHSNQHCFCTDLWNIQGIFSSLWKYPTIQNKIIWTCVDSFHTHHEWANNLLRANSLSATKISIASHSTIKFCKIPSVPWNQNFIPWMPILLAPVWLLMEGHLLVPYPSIHVTNIPSGDCSLSTLSSVSALFFPKPSSHSFPHLPNPQHDSNPHQGFISRPVTGNRRAPVPVYRTGLTGYRSEPVEFKFK